MSDVSAVRIDSSGRVAQRIGETVVRVAMPGFPWHSAKKAPASNRKLRLMPKATRSDQSPMPW
ncbi:hypothetical protein [Pseudoxanthomonas sacheonensis]|uniref:hypothetical protein n=1 Tax=Pseudoxanthomonas sacheonensis TaxID=443615 RepID=UPI0013CFE4A2|nr:hypothetical protein [Pseudoxanthomonas sacheonensis]KAF1710769.1 hypothetical protein CSC73_04100 [Pseudoxanthomonas sacheonensis]